MADQTAELNSYVDSSSSTSTEMVNLDELINQIEAVSISETTATTSVVTATNMPTTHRRLTVAERLSPLVTSISETASRIFNFQTQRTEQNPVAPLSKSVFLDTLISPSTQLEVRHVSLNGLEYLLYPCGTETRALQDSVHQLQYYSADYLQKRHDIIIHTFPPRGDSTVMMESRQRYYDGLLRLIQQKIYAIQTQGYSHIIESLKVTAGSSNTNVERSVDLSTYLSNKEAYNTQTMSEKISEMLGQQFPAHLTFLLLHLRFEDTRFATSFRNTFNNASTKLEMSQLFGVLRSPYCHFAATAPEILLRKALQTYCHKLNNEATRVAVDSDFEVPARVRYTTNGINVYQKMEYTYGPLGSAKVPIERNTELSHKRGAIFTLHKYAYMYKKKQISVIIRYLREVCDMMRIYELVRCILHDVRRNLTAEKEANDIDLESFSVHEMQPSRLIRVTLASPSEAMAFKLAYNKRLRGKNVATIRIIRGAEGETGLEFDNIDKTVQQSFAHSDLTPPELALHRRLREFCRERKRQNSESLYFMRDTALMRVPRK